MTNEELIMNIRAGATELYSDLWERVRRFVYRQANRYKSFFHGNVIDVEDLTQGGYLALVEAVKTYDPDAGAGLLCWLNFHLIKTWRAMFGLRGRSDPLNDAVSLDEPLTGETDATLIDVTEDPAAAFAFDLVDEKLFIEDLRAALDRALSKAPHGDIVRRRYFQGQTQREIAEELRCSPSAVSQKEKAAIRYLRAGPFSQELRSFDYYSGTGLQSWRNSRTSVEERYVIEKEKQAGKKQYGYR